MSSAALPKGVSKDFKDKVETISIRKSGAIAGNRLNVLIATIDPGMRNDLAEILESFPLNPVWAQGIEAAKNILANQPVAVCFSGFWLQDGTYRELVRHIRREDMNIPVVIVSGPSCPREYGDYLSAMNIGSLGFLCHPYRRADMERILEVAVNLESSSCLRQSSSAGPEVPPGAAAA